MNGYELRRNPPCNRKVNDWLIKHGKNITSQGGEDGIIDFIFNKIIPFDSTSSTRWCVEFGAWDGKHLSNTWNLLYNKSNEWSGILIEADNIKYNELVQNYTNYTNVTCIQEFIEFNGPKSLDNILEQYKTILPYDFDFISIDIDGADYHIWDHLKLFRPKLVIIEFNPTIPNNIIFIQEKNMKIYHGSSIAAMVELGKRKGYELISTTTYNAFFIDKKYYSLFNIKNNHLDYMHTTPIQTELFQLYDGTIKISGCKKLIWKKIPMNEDKMQMIPKLQRNFPFAPSDTKNQIEKNKNVIKDIKTNEINEILTCISVSETISDLNIKDINNKLNENVSKITCSNKLQNSILDISTFLFNLIDQLLKDNKIEISCKWTKVILKLIIQYSSCNLNKLEWMCRMGYCYFRLKNYEKCEFWLKISITVDSNYKPSWKLLAKMYHKQNNEKKLQEAIAELKK